MNSIEIDGEDIVVRCGSYEDNTAMKMLPGSRADVKNGAWRVFATPHNANAIINRFKNYTIHESVYVVLKKEKLLEEIKFGEITKLEKPEKTKHTAWDHQIRAYNYMKASNGALLDYGMGTGKTKIAVDFIQNDVKSGRILITSPKSVVPVWPKEFSKHLASENRNKFIFAVVGCPIDEFADYSDMDVRVIKGNSASKVQKLVQIDNLATAMNKILVIIINYESVWIEAMNVFVSKRAWALMICDESHKIKSPGGKASRFFGRVGTLAQRRYCLTGTPIPNSPVDVYGQFRFFDPGVYGKNFSVFKTKYVVMGGFENRQIVGYQNEQDFNKKYHSATISCDRSVIELPEELSPVERFYELSADEMKAYKSMRDLMVAEIKDGLLTAGNALTKYLRLQQIVCGYLPNEDGTVTKIGTSRRDLLHDIVEEIGKQPIVVFCKFWHDLDNVKEVAESFGYKYLEQSGRAAEWTNFQNGEGDIIGVQIQSGGLGIDLTRSHYVIFYSIGYSLGDYEQARCRISRPGQKSKSVTFVQVKALKTVDMRIYKAILTKRQVIDYLLEGEDW